MGSASRRTREDKPSQTSSERQVSNQEDSSSPIETTLDQFIGDNTNESVADFSEISNLDGARYGRTDANPDPDPQCPTNECLACGRVVPAGVARVIGDNDGCVRGCPSCSETTDQWSRADREARGLGVLR